MPKDTFHNLDQEKKQKVTKVLLEEFSHKPFSKVNVKSIAASYTHLRAHET